MKATSKPVGKGKNSAPIGKWMWLSEREEAEAQKELAEAGKEKRFRAKRGLAARKEKKRLGAR